MRPSQAFELAVKHKDFDRARRIALEAIDRAETAPEKTFWTRRLKAIENGNLFKFSRVRIRSVK